MNNKSTDEINIYIEEVRQLLPYSNLITKEAIELFRNDVQSASEDGNHQSLNEIFGKPKEVAINICKSHNWHKERASWVVRIIAWLIDSLIKFSLIGIIVLGFLLIFRDQMKKVFSTSRIYFFTHLTLESLILSALILIAGLTALAIPIVYNIMLEGYYNTTIGKKILHLIVVDQSGIKMSWKQAIIRNLSKYATLDLVLGILPIDTLLGIIIEKTDQTKAFKQRAFDIIAETIVIKEPKDNK
jgi:uncharacterized RDD family membrane protein YckC